jgi:hypothetical protein
MLLVIPPADVTVAESPVALKVCTRDSAASNRMHPAGFLSGTTRNSIGALGIGAVCVDACGIDACCVEHPATAAVAIARMEMVPVKLGMRFPPFEVAVPVYREWTLSGFGTSSQEMCSVSQ